MKSKLPLMGAVTLALFLGSCQKHDRLEISEEIQKIETNWDGVSEKINSDVSTPKFESVASDVILNHIKSEVQHQYNDYLQKFGRKPHTELLNNWVGVVKHNSTAGPSGCNGYDELEIEMDCEDTNPKTTWKLNDPYLGSISPDYTYNPASWTIGGNAIMRFCIVPGDDFHPFLESVGGSNGTYAVLRVTTNFFADAKEISRRFDNEDRRNANTATLRFGNIRTPSRNGQGVSVKNNSADNDNTVYRTYIDGNSYLSFHIFGVYRDVPPGAVAISDYPSFNGLSYGVLGGENTPLHQEIGLLKVDDEDSNNANLYFDDEGGNGAQIDLWNALRNIAEGRNGDMPSVIPGNQSPIAGQDTYVFISRVK